MGQIRWYKRDPDAALQGMFELNLEERGAYNTVLDLIYSKTNQLPDDERFIAGCLRCDVRVWKRIRRRLIALGKIYLDDGCIRNKRADHEVLRALSRGLSARDAGKASARKRRVADKENKQLDITDVATGVSTNPESRIQKRDSDGSKESPKTDSESSTKQCPPSAGDGPLSGRSEDRLPALQLVPLPVPEPPPKPVLKFDEWWACWSIAGTKRAPRKAEPVYGRLIRTGQITHDQLCDGVRRYMRWCQQQGAPPSKIKHPTTWLNGGCWDDELVLDGQSQGGAGREQPKKIPRGQSW
jgi:uncharacterized protein YdaU (DUF1376 family)